MEGSAKAEGRVLECKYAEKMSALMPPLKARRGADEGDGLQIWTSPANIARQPKKDGPLGWGMGEVLTNLHRKTPACYEMLHRYTDLDGFFGTN